MCGDSGIGAMAPVDAIALSVRTALLLPLCSSESGVNPDVRSSKSGVTTSEFPGLDGAGPAAEGV